jgi:hypothetical protein
MPDTHNVANSKRTQFNIWDLEIIFSVVTLYSQDRYRMERILCSWSDWSKQAIMA